jgi:hypothetical protein
MDGIVQFSDLDLLKSIIPHIHAISMSVVVGLKSDNPNFTIGISVLLQSKYAAVLGPSDLDLMATNVLTAWNC